MKAMLLAAGLGRRMYPLTLTLAKPAIPVLGRPLLLQVLHYLAGRGVTDAVLNLHHRPDDIQRLVAGAGAGLPDLQYTHEEEILGTAGGIKNAASALRGDGPIVVSNSDYLTNIDLSLALEAHRASDCLATMVLAPWRPGYSQLLRDAEGRVLSIAGVPEVDPRQAEGAYLFTGCHIIEEELLDRIPGDGPSCMIRDVYRPLAAEGRLGSVVHGGFWWEFGSLVQYLEGCLQLLELPRGELNRISAEHDSLQQRGGATVAVGAGAEIDDGARIAGRAAIGFGSHISEGARIEDSVIMPEAWIGPRCNVRRAILGPGVELPAGFTVEDAAISPDLDPSFELPPETRREAGLLIHPFATADAG